MDGSAGALRVAVVGSGPAAFYAAGHLLVSEEPQVEVDMIERLPTPWGLVRLGVAPDHPQLKTVSRAFEKIAARPGFRFLGNVEVGRDVTQTSSPGSTTPWSTRSARRWTGGSGFPARTWADRGPRQSSSPGTTATPTSRSSSSTSRASARSSSGTGTSRSTSHGCSRSRTRSSPRPIRRRRHRGDRRLRDPGDPRSRSPRAGAGVLDVRRAAGARRARRCGRAPRPRGARARAGERH